MTAYECSMPNAASSRLRNKDYSTTNQRWTGEASLHVLICLPRYYTPPFDVSSSDQVLITGENEGLSPG